MGCYIAKKAINDAYKLCNTLSKAFSDFEQKKGNQYCFTTTDESTFDNFINDYDENAVGENICEIDFSSEIYPFIENVNTDYFVRNQTMTLIIEGYNFGVHPKVILDGCNVTIISKTQTKIICDVVATTQNATTLLKVKVGDKISYEDDLTFNIMNYIIGTGQAGVFNTTFVSKSNPTAPAIEVFEPSVRQYWDVGAIDCDVNKLFNTSVTTTPSSNTGAGYPIFNGQYYLFTEYSSPQTGDLRKGYIKTTNFKKLDLIEFDYHMFGNGIVAIRVQYLLNDVWTDLGSIVGQQQQSSNDPWLHYSLDVSNYNIDTIRILFDGGSTYSADYCIDNIKLTSSEGV